MKQTVRPTKMPTLRLTKRPIMRLTIRLKKRLTMRPTMRPTKRPTLRLTMRVTGDSAVAVQVDVYSLGCILNECWSRRRPWPNDHHFFQVCPLHSLSCHPPLTAC